MKRLGAIAGGVVVGITLLVVAFGLFIQYNENKQLSEIHRLAYSGDYLSSFNLAQNLLDDLPFERVQAKALYWQGYCLYKKGEPERAAEKIRQMLMVDAGYDRMSEDEAFQQFYANVRHPKD